MTKPAQTTPDTARDNEWSDVLPASPSAPNDGRDHGGQLPSATTRTSGLRPALPPSHFASEPLERLPLPSRLPVLHPADEGNDRTIQRNVSFAELDFDDADRTTELAPDQMSRLAATTFPSDVPPAQPPRPTLPAPARLAPLPPQAFPSLSELASRAHDAQRGQHGQHGQQHEAAQALGKGRAMVGSVGPVDAHLHASNRPMPWVPTPPLPRSDQRLVTALIVIGAFLFTAAVALAAAMWVVHR